MTKEELAELATLAARAAVEATRIERERANERIYGIEAIAAECNVDRHSIRRWVNSRGFPLDKDPRGYSVRRWNLERWFEAHRQAVAALK